MKIFLLLTAIPLITHARLTDNQVVIQIDQQQFNITTKKGFHLNEAAPASAMFDGAKEKKNPDVKKSNIFTFKINENNKVADVSFYVCDDKKTVCEQHKRNLNLKSGEVKQETIKAAYSRIEDFNLKSQNGKPTLLVFSAPWCPACIRMQTETYSKDVVKKQIAKLNFVKLNSDLAENYELSEKFGIRAIPTMILIDKDGNEVFRWLDFFAAADFAKELNLEIKKISQASEQLKKAQLGDPAAAADLGYKAYNSMNFSEAVKWFSLAKKEKDIKFKLAAEVSAARESADADSKALIDYLSTLEKAITLTTSKLDRLRWTTDYLEVKKSQGVLSPEATHKALRIANEIEELMKNQSLMKKAFDGSTYGNYGGFEKVELLWMRAKIFDLLGAKKEEKDLANQQSIKEVLKKKLSVDRPGEMLLAIAYLREAGETKKVSKMYEELTKKYPTTYVYFEKYARFVQKNKDYGRALVLVNEALKFPEGNEPQLALLKTQILKDMNKKDEAIDIINKVLSAEYISHKRYARTVKKLNELKEEISKTK